MAHLHDIMAPLMFAGLVCFLIIGYPAAFSLGAVGLFFAIFGIKFGMFEPAFMGNMTYQVFSVLSNDLLLAIPFFTFMGAVLERCGLAEDLLDSIGQLFGPVRGGMSHVVAITHHHGERDHAHGDHGRSHGTGNGTEDRADDDHRV
jgi:TRAP-type mannitol/chloroaromatic compound transport system permease large subunit